MRVFVASKKTMSAYVGNVFPILKILAKKKTSRKLVKALFDEPAYQADLFRSIDEIFYNIAWGTENLFRLSPNAKKVLKQHRKIIEKLAQLSKNTSVKNRSLVLKYGTVLFPVFLPPVLKVLKDLVDEK